MPSGAPSSVADEVDAFRITMICLTPRLREIALLVGEGLTNKEIGSRLFISPWTVKSCVGRITEIFADHGALGDVHYGRARIGYLLGYADGINAAKGHAGMVYKVVQPRRTHR